MQPPFPDSVTENGEGVIVGLVLPDRDDRPVLATAIAGHSDAIVALSLKDFPAEALDPH